MTNQTNSNSNNNSNNSNKNNDKKIKLREIFDKFDVDKDGSINKQELKNGFKVHGIEIQDEQISKMFEIADSNKNHKIEWEEFFGIVGESESHELEDIAEYWLTKPGMTRMVTAPLNKDAHIIPSWKLLLSGGVAGAVSRTCTSPLERLKILNQVQFLKLESNSPQYKGGNGVIRSLVTMFKTEGFLGLFKGNGTNVIRIAPYSAIQFLSYEKYKNFVMENYGGPRKHLSTSHNLIVGGAAGVTSLIFTYPLDLIRSRLTVQVHSSKYTGIGDAYKKIVAEEGYRALYKGVVASAVGVAPYVAINFTTYENLKRFLMKDKTPSVIESLAFGAISGATAQTVTYPIDLIRRRLQVQGIGGKPVLYNGLFDAMRKIVKDEGVRGLYNGMVPCYLKVIPAISISFCVYEVMKNLLKIESNKVSYST